MAPAPVIPPRASGSSRSSGGDEKRPKVSKDSEPAPSSSAALAAEEAASREVRSRSRSRSRSPHRGTVSTQRATRSGTSRERRQLRNRAEAQRNRGFRFSHILIKHEDSRRPKDLNNKPVTRTKNEAMRLVIDIHDKVTKNLITFADAAVSFSDCTSARFDGDVQSHVKNGKMMRTFKTAALTLAPGQVSQVIESHSGFHILQRRE